MRVEPFNYPLENTLVKKLDVMLKRCTQKNPKRDAVLLIEGAEGEGKTSYSIAIGYYARWKTGRSFSHENVFFDLNKMIEFLKNSEGQIAIWDEPAAQAMSTDWAKSVVKDLKRLLIMARKKRHFIMINMAYFSEFSPYIVWQRPLGMIHVYSRNELHAGRFVYVKKRNLELLYNDWRTKKRRNYKKWCSKAIRGTFPDVLNPDYKHNVLSEFDVDAYEAQKDAAISNIGEEQVNKKDIENRALKYVLAKLATVELLRKWLIIGEATPRRWRAEFADDYETYKSAKESRHVPLIGG